MAKAAKRARDKVVYCIVDVVIGSKDKILTIRKCLLSSILLSSQCFSQCFLILNECAVLSYGCCAVKDEVLDMDSEKSESRFRSDASQ